MVAIFDQFSSIAATVVDATMELVNYLEPRATTWSVIVGICPLENPQVMPMHDMFLLNYDEWLQFVTNFLKEYLVVDMILETCELLSA